MSTPAPRQSLRVAPRSAPEIAALVGCWAALCALLVVSFRASRGEAFWSLAVGWLALWFMFYAVETVIRRRRVARCITGEATGHPWRGPPTAAPWQYVLALLALVGAVALAVGEPSPAAAPMLALGVALPLGFAWTDRELRRFDALAITHEAGRSARQRG